MQILSKSEIKVDSFSVLLLDKTAVQQTEAETRQEFKFLRLLRNLF